jgi:hypothetical protein
LPFGTKQMSWLSGLSATGRPSARERAHLGLGRPPSGKRRIVELRGVVANRK